MPHSTTHKKHDGTPSAEDLERAKENAHYYDGKKRCNVPAIVVEFNISRAVFYKWQRRGWPALKGERLTSIPESLRVYGRFEETYRVADVARAVKRHPSNCPTY